MEACACRKVEWFEKKVSTGATTGWWACILCLRPFIPSIVANRLIQEALLSSGKGERVNSEVMGMSEVELEAALKADIKDKAARGADGGTMHAPPSPVGWGRIASKVAEPPEKKASVPTGDLPAGVKMVLWIPITQGDGRTVFQCSVDGWGFSGVGSHSRKLRALSLALEDISAKMVSADAQAFDQERLGT